MTIIEPHKAKYAYNPAVLVMIFLVMALASLNIYFYNKSVNLKHSISIISKDLQGFRVSNAELRGRLYKITNLDALDLIVKSKGLVKESKPQYIENKSEVLAIN